MIKIKDLCFRYSNSKVDAIKNLSFKISKGEFVAIIGHNGSGKSTLSKILTGLYKPTGGTISIDRIIMSKKTLKIIRKKIGIVFQNPENQFVGSTVEDDIAFGLENKKISMDKMKKLVLKYAKMVDMESHLDHEPSSLSGGQKQKVAIASTLALDPKIIIFDEVTSMLDPKGKREIINIIKKIQLDKNKILISITHDMDEAVLADQIIVLSNGKLVAAGDPKLILNNKKITNLAKIDAPFIYKISKALSSKKIKPTYDKEELLGAICK